MSRPFALAAWLPTAAFVLIWSTGFIVGKAIVPLADTSLFLLGRFAVAGLMFVACRWPRVRHGRRCARRRATCWRER